MAAIVKRARKYETSVAKFRRWRSTCGQFALVEITSTLGLSKRYVVVERHGNGNESVVSRHRKRRAAERRLAQLHTDGE